MTALRLLGAVFEATKCNTMDFKGLLKIDIEVDRR